MKESQIIIILQIKNNVGSKGTIGYTALTYRNMYIDDNNYNNLSVEKL